MASSQNRYTVEDLHNATTQTRWEEVRNIITAQPQLVNEKYDGMTSLFTIVLHYAPQDLVLQSLRKATAEVVDYEWRIVRRCILHYLADLGYSQALRSVLKKSHFNVNLRDLRGNTPLHFLLRAEHSFRDHLDITGVLLKAGANCDIKNSRGRTPADEYMLNQCKNYDGTNITEQKDELLKLLPTGTVPMEILARGAAALKAFNEALSDGKTEVNQGRTMFMGLERAGKTSTIKSFLKNPFDPNEGITDAIAHSTACTHDLHDELNWSETANDHSEGTDFYEDKIADSMARQLLETATEKKESSAGTPEVEIEHIHEPLSPIAKASDTKIEDQQPDIKRKRKNPSTQPIEEVPNTIASKVQERMNAITFTEASTDWRKSGNDFIMNIWDFGGQPIYHVIQRIFLCSFAIVCVVFNLEHDLDAPANVRDPTTNEIYQHRMTNLQFILYWIRSAYTNSRDLKFDDGQLSPPVLVIGTHLDSLEGNEDEKKKKAEGIFCKIREALKDKPYEAMVFPTFFAIENSLPFSMSNASSIMSQILKFAKKMVRILPLKWLLVQQEIKKLKGRIYLPTDEVIALVDRFGVKHDAQRVLLQYLHDVGEILYFPDDKALQDIIVLDLMRIVDMFKTVITVVDPQLMEQALEEAWRKLDSGLLEEQLLRHLWKKFDVTDDTFDFYVSLMQKFGLVCEKKMTAGGERIFYVLSRLKPVRVYKSPTENYGKKAISIFHDFEDYLPDDLFQRGVTKFIEKFQVENDEPKLSYEYVELKIDEFHHVVLNVASIKHRRMFQTTIRREKGELKPAVCKKVLSFLEVELNVFCQGDARGVKLTRYIRCMCNNAHMHTVPKFDQDTLSCGGDDMAVSRYRLLFEGVSSLPDSSQSQRPVPKGLVDDLSIKRVSEEMDHSWRTFGIRLGVSWSKVDSYGTNKQEAVRNMLELWRNSIDRERHQLEVLCTALRIHDTRFGSLADTLFQRAMCGESRVIEGHAEYFKDEDLLFICDNLGSEWRRLGVRLGLKWADIKNISEKRKERKDRIMDVLVTWRGGQTTNQIKSNQTKSNQIKSNQIAIMINALRKQNLVQLAATVRERHGYCKDEVEAKTTQMSSHQVSTHVEGCLNDEDMLFISEKLGKDWKSFGTKIGLGKSDIENIEMDSELIIEDAILEMLIQWRKRQKAGVNHLVMMSDALNRLERNDIKEELNNYYREKYN